MKTNIKLTGVHQGAPIDIAIEIEMTPAETISYVKEVLPFVKKMTKQQNKG